MGQAKLRGTYEQRKAEAEARNAEKSKNDIALRREIQRRKPSPKHTQLMAAAAVLTMGALGSR